MTKFGEACDVSIKNTTGVSHQLILKIPLKSNLYWMRPRKPEESIVILVRSGVFWPSIVTRQQCLF